MSIKSIDCVLIWSEKPFELAKFYKDKLGLKQAQKLTHPKDTGILFELESGPYLWIGKHSEVKGKCKEPARHMLNFLVESIESEYEKLKKEGVKFIAKPFEGPVENGYFATFEDTDGNLLQLWSEKR